MSPVEPTSNVERFLRVLGPADYLRAVGKRWWLAALCGVMGFGLTAAYSYFHPAAYESAAVLRFNPPQLANRFVQSNDALQSEQRLFALVQMLRSSLTARKMIESFGLYPELRRFYPVEDLVPDFQAALIVKKVSAPTLDTRIGIPSLQIAYSYADPEKARQVVQQLVEAVYESTRRFRGDQSEGTTEFLSSQVDSSRELLEELESQLGDLKMPDRTSGDHNWALRTQQLFNLEHKLGQVQASLRNMRRDLADKQQEVIDLEARIRRANILVTDKTEQRTWELQSLNLRLHQASVAVEELLERYRPEHAEVVEARRVAESLARQVQEREKLDLESARERFRRELTVKAEQLKADARALEESIARQQAEELALTRRASELRAAVQTDSVENTDFLRLDREYSVMRDFHQGLLRKQQESLVAAEMERLGRGESVELVEPPLLPTRVKGWNGPVRVTVGALCGIALGVFIALAGLLTNPPVRRRKHFALWSGVELLAEIPPALIPDSGAQRSGIWSRVRRRATVPAIALICAAAAQMGCGAGLRGDAQHFFRSARESEGKGDLLKAIRLYRLALAKDAKLADAHDSLARLELDIGEIAAAYAHLVRAAELKPEDQRVLLRLADLTYQIYFADASRPQPLLLELEELAQKMTQRTPTAPEGAFYHSIVLVERHRAKEAADLLSAAIDRAGLQPLLVTQLASVEHKIGRKDRAVERLQRLIDGGCDYRPAYDLLYLHLMERGEIERAGSVLKRKWEVIHDIDSGLQFAAHLYAQSREADSQAQVNTVAESLSRGEPTVLAQVGDFWLHRARLDLAKQAYDEGLRTAKTERSLYIGRLVEWNLALRNRGAALQILSDELRAQPKNDLLMAYKHALEMDGASKAELMRSRKELESILTRMPKSAFVRYHLGRAYLRLGDVVQGERQLENCLRLDPNYVPGWLALAEADFARGNLARATQRTQTILDRAPTYGPGLLLKARLEASQGKLEAAESTLEALARQGVPARDILLERAGLRLLSNDAEGTIRLLEPAILANPEDQRILVLLAGAEAAAGATARALERLEHALARDPTSAFLWKAKAEVTFKAGQYAAAADCYRRLHEREPGDATAVLGLADSLAMQGRFREAVEQYKQAQNAMPADLRPWLHSASVLQASGNIAGARDAYSRALALDGQHPVVLNNLAYLLARKGERLTYALQLAQQADRMMPNSPEISDTLIYIHLRSGTPEQALTLLDRIQTKAPPADRPYWTKVSQEVRKGRVDAAAQFMEQTRDARPIHAVKGGAG